MLLIVTLVLGLGVLRSARPSSLRFLALAGSTPAGVAVVVGGQGLPVFFLVATLSVLASMWAHLKQPLRPTPKVVGLPLMALLISWTAFISLLAPYLFNRHRTVLPRPYPLALQAATITTSNIAQLFYLALGLAIVIVVAHSASASPTLLGFPLFAVIGLSFWRYLAQQSGLPFPDGVFDNAPNAVLIQTAAGGTPRFRGILTEPASLATFCLIAAAWGTSFAWATAGLKRGAALLLVAAALFLGFLSTSATFVIAASLLASLAITVVLIDTLATRRLPVSRFLVIAATGTAVLVFFRQLASFVQLTVDRKVDSTSFTDRSGVDGASWNQVLSTYGLGVGIGANRGSALLPSLTASVGILGAAAFLLLVTLAITRGIKDSALRPAMWVLLATLITRFISGPDISDTSGLLWISLGLLLSHKTHEGSFINSLASNTSGRRSFSLQLRPSKR